MRVEQIGDCTLYLGDCLAILPTLGPVDAVVTDPPYGIGAGTGIGKVTKEGSDFRDREQWDDSVPDKAVFDTLRAMSRHQIIWGGNYFDLPPSKCFLVWDKIQPEQFSLAMAEMAWTNVNSPAKIFRWKSMSINGGAPKAHPTQKPHDLMGWCLGFLPKAQTILDPFMGSGTTLVACAKLGRKGIGIEIDPGYFDIACRRVEEAYRQPDMFIERPAAPVQETLL
jgi:DNA modification methylase